jgi:hypothetical protein
MAEVSSVSPKHNIIGITLLCIACLTAGIIAGTEGRNFFSRISITSIQQSARVVEQANTDAIAGNNAALARLWSDFNDSTRSSNR